MKKMISLPTSIWKEECDEFFSRWSCPISMSLPIIPVKTFLDLSQPYDVFSLISAKRRGITTDPLTRRPLNVTEDGKIKVIELSPVYRREKEKLFKNKTEEEQDLMVLYMFPEEDIKLISEALSENDNFMPSTSKGSYNNLADSDWDFMEGLN